MAKLIYSTIASLDGFVADDAGRFDWGGADEEVYAYVNDLERPVGTYLYGRRMYETMVSWETIDLGEKPPSVRDFATLWRSARKIVFSKTCRPRRARGRASSATSTPKPSAD
jgi:RibD C-terminal domain